MEQIEYTRTVVPSSMRSPYWKYFGFPSDNGNNILTRQKIVCTICNAAIAYNKNTSNLRTHLMSKHVELFKKIVTQQNSTMTPKQDILCTQNSEEHARSLKGDDTASEYVNINSDYTKRQRLEIFSGDQLTSKNNNNVENFLILPEYNNSESESTFNRGNNPTTLKNKMDLGISTSDYITCLPSCESEIVEVEETNAEVYNISNLDYIKDGKAFAHSFDVHENSLDIMLADLIQTDLLPLDTLEELGFSKYNQQITGLKIDSDTVRRVRRIIETRYTDIKRTVTSHLNRLSQSQPYSLSFEIYSDTEGQNVLNIYFNYLSDNKMDLISILYASSAICSKAANISELLTEINLKNCSAVVVTCLDDVIEFVSDFATFHKLPLIECLESMITRCLQKIFDQTDFYADYEKFLKFILESKSETRLKKSNFRSQCSWSTLNFLECVFKNLEENKLEQWGELRQSFEYLKPLKLASDIITDEPLPLCSLSRPVIKKLFEEHFSSTKQGESGISDIQKILRKELYERIMAQNFLSEVTFFDTRFHRDFALQEPLFDINNLKTQVVKRYKHILQVSYVNKLNNAMSEQNSVDCCVNIRKCSSLKSFFKREVSMTNADITTDLKTNLDLEFEQYHAEACLDLDQSPVLWWQQQTESYKQLSKIAENYLTIPCCCLPRLLRIESEQRYLKLNRRKNLSQFCTTESKLWYLYYNEDVAELL